MIKAGRGDGINSGQPGMRPRGRRAAGRRLKIPVKETPAKAPTGENRKRRRSKNRQGFLPHPEGPGWGANPGD